MNWAGVSPQASGPYDLLCSRNPTFFQTKNPFRGTRRPTVVEGSTADFNEVQFLTHNREKQCNCIQMPLGKASVASTARTSHNFGPRPLHYPIRSRFYSLDQIIGSTNLNVHELEAILLAIEAWGRYWNQRSSSCTRRTV